MPVYTRICLLILLCLSGCTKNDTAPQLELPRPVRTARLESLGTIDKTYTGVAEAAQFSILAFKISGTLTELNVSQGQYVPEGYVIARINPTDYELNYQTAETNYRIAQAIYERTQRLLEQNATALQNLEIARADYIQAGAAVDIAANTLGYTVIKAPFSGIIEQKYVENYQQVMVGESIVRLVNPAQLEVRFVLPETAISLINAPKTILVRFDTQSDRWYKAEVKEYVYSSDGSGIPVTLRITDKNFHPRKDEIYPGFSCQILFKIENRVANNFVIPSAALYTQNNNTYVWLVNPVSHTVSMHPVDIRRVDDKIVVEKGLNSNDILVIAGADDLKNGQKVSVINSNL